MKLQLFGCMIVFSFGFSFLMNKNILKNIFIGMNGIDVNCLPDFSKGLNLTVFTSLCSHGYSLSFSNALQAPLNPKASTTLITHGWHSAGNSDWLIKMKDKYLAKTNNNLIIVDWGFFAQDNYIAAIDEIRDIGTCVAEILIRLVQAMRINVDSLHLVGHSLGAHVAGVIGKTIQVKLNKVIYRITALDAAQPGFSNEMFERLNRYDARFVDAIHTDGGFLGIDEPFALVDFFPNGGTGDQPGCNGFDLYCSHARAYELYLESIDSNDFVAKKCHSYRDFEKGFCDDGLEETMGLATRFIDGGTFFLRTYPQSPFAHQNN